MAKSDRKPTPNRLKIGFLQDLDRVSTLRRRDGSVAEAEIKVSSLLVVFLDMGPTRVTHTMTLVSAYFILVLIELEREGLLDC